MQYVCVDGSVFPCAVLYLGITRCRVPVRVGLTAAMERCAQAARQLDLVSHFGSGEAHDGVPRPMATLRKQREEGPSRACGPSSPSPPPWPTPVPRPSALEEKSGRAVSCEQDGSASQTDMYTVVCSSSGGGGVALLRQDDPQRHEWFAYARAAV